MPGIDNPTRRVVTLILLLILVAAALHGYLPRYDHVVRTEPGGGRAALLFIITAVAATTALLAVAVIARLRDPRTLAPSAGDLSDMLGGDKGRPSWRVLLIGVGVIVAWLLVATLLAHMLAPHGGGAPAVATDSTTSSSAPGNALRAKPPQNPTGDAFGLLAASVAALLLVLVAGAAVAWRRRPKPTPGTPSQDGTDTPSSPPSDSLARAAEVGLAEMADPRRDPREAIIACYAAMERELANVPGAAPQEFDTATEVIARAVDHYALHLDNAFQLVNLFAEARFSPHVMNEGHRELAQRVLALVLDELRPARLRDRAV